tara:strand:+ start:1280 stop:1444 length:165 start_codon:yes stop_codon:yes gene_type:complete
MIWYSRKYAPDFSIIQPIEQAVYEKVTSETFAQSRHQDEMAKTRLLFVGKLGNS